CVQADGRPSLDPDRRRVGVPRPGVLVGRVPDDVLRAPGVRRGGWEPARTGARTGVAKALRETPAPGLRALRVVHLPLQFAGDEGAVRRSAQRDAGGTGCDLDAGR